MPYWSPEPPSEDPPAPEPPPALPPPHRDFGAEARQAAQQRLAVLVTLLRNANPPNVMFEPQAAELRNLCRILGLTLTIDRIDLNTGTVERITIDPHANVTG